MDGKNVVVFFWNVPLPMKIEFFIVILTVLSVHINVSFQFSKLEIWTQFSPFQKQSKIKWFQSQLSKLQILTIHLYTI